MALRLKMKKCVETIQITLANEYVTFGFSFRILVFLLGKFERHSL